VAHPSGKPVNIYPLDKGLQVGSMVYDLATAFFLGSTSWVLLDVGIAVQKVGYNIDKRRTMKRGSIWGLGLLMTGLSILFSYVAIDLSDPSVFASLVGVGLVAVAIFSFFVLGEKLNRIMMTGILLIGIGTVFFSYFAEEMAISLDLTTLIVFVVVVLFTSAVITFFSLGIVAGILGGLGIIFQEYVTDSTDVISQSVFFVVWAVVTGVSFLVMQLSLVRGKAVNVVPSFNSSKVILPQLATTFVFAQSIDLVQLLGLGLIVVGIVLLTHFKVHD
jgi:uncharacterized membrane protein